jgi:hypothetical protein
MEGRMISARGKATIILPALMVWAEAAGSIWPASAEALRFLTLAAVLLWPFAVWAWCSEYQYDNLRKVLEDLRHHRRFNRR